jgi:hypothetical protein
MQREHEVASVISPRQASSSHPRIPPCLERALLAWIIVGPEGDILQCDMFAERASEHYCSQGRDRRRIAIPGVH